jgi:protein-disulfide isomerase
MRNDRLAFAGSLVLAALLGGGVVLAGQALLAGAGARGTVEQTVHRYIMAHPEVLLDSVDQLRAKEAEKAQRAQADAEGAAAKALPAMLPKATTPYAGAWAGNPNGDVTVVAFMDYACGYCRASLPAIDELIRRDPGVRIVYREFPVLGPDSLVAARWALAAAEQGKFRAFHDALFAMDGPSAANIQAAAQKAALDLSAAERAVRSQPVEQEIKANHRFGQELAMSGTPAWIVGGRLLYGMRDYGALAEAVAAARKGK